MRPKQRGSRKIGNDKRAMSFIYMMNKRGLRMKPWGTSEVTSDLEDVEPFMITC